MDIKEIQSRNYSATVSRGLITPKTTDAEFISKLFEEIHELDNSRRFFGKSDPHELADIMIVCLNMAHHLNIDIEKSISEKTVINEKRALQ